MARYVAAIDQGTTSTRLILFDRDGRIAAVEQARALPDPPPRGLGGARRPRDLAANPRSDRRGARRASDLAPDEIAAVGITNQRETTVIWDRETGEPLHNAIVWQDTRTAALVRELAGEQGPDRLRERVGLPLSTYFSGPKIAWLLENVPGARARAQAGELAFGTIDAWLLWNLTGASAGRRARHRRDQREPHDADGPAHARLARAEPGADGHPARSCCPRSAPPARSTARCAARRRSRDARSRRMVGDQQAALFGQTCFGRGRGQEHLRHGLLPARQHRRGDRALPVAAHERRGEGRRGDRPTTCSRARSR